MARGVKKAKAVLTPEEKLAKALVPVEEQPYPVPGNWCWVKMAAVCDDFQYGYTEKATFERIGPHFIRISDIGNGIVYDNDAPFCKIEPEVYQKYKIHKGDIFIARMGSVGENGLAIQDIDGVFASYLIRLVPRISPDTIRWYLQSSLYWSQITDKSQGTTRLNVNANVLRSLMFPLPPVAEQQRIVDRIESLFAKLDEAKEKAQAVVDGFEDRKAAILHKAFTGSLTKEWRKAHKSDMSSWKHVHFAELCDIVRGGSPRPAGDPKYYDGPIPFMKVADITNNNGPYVSSAEHSIKEAGLKKTRLIGPNTLLLTNSGATLGVPAICTFQTTFNDGIAAFLNLNLDSLLFYYYFWLSKTQELRAINMGAAQPNLNTSIIGAVEIDVPPVDEQKEIVRLLDSVLNKEQQVKESAEQALTQIDTMKKAILARAFRGELGTNDPADESAEELLKRLL